MLLDSLTSNSWILYVFSIVFVALIASFIEKRIFKQMHARLEKTRTFWDDTIIYALHHPLNTLIWVMGVLIAAQVTATQMGNLSILHGLVYAKKLSIIIAFVWFILRFINRSEKRYLTSKKSKKFDQSTLKAMSKLIKLAVFITAALITMQSFNIPISPLLAFGGLGGLAVSMAAKDILANFFAGLMLFFDRPFTVGDWVRSPDRNIEGTVEHIGWRLTKIRTFDKRVLYVPNGIFSTVSLENPSRMTNRRIRTNVGLRYGDAPKIKMILADIKAMLESHQDIDTEQTLMVNLVEFGSSSLNFMIYTFTKTTNWVEFQAVQEDVFIKVIDIITQHGAECAFPTSTLHIPEGVQINSQMLEETS